MRVTGHAWRSDDSFMEHMDSGDCVLSATKPNSAHSSSSRQVREELKARTCRASQVPLAPI